MLKGKKIAIRPLEEEDLESLYQWYSDQEVNLWSSGAWPLNTLFSKEKIIDKFFDQPLHRYAILNEQNVIIGTIGFDNHNIPAHSASLFISIGEKEYWDKGYGTDALIVFIRFLFTQWNLHRLSLDTWDGNLRALKAYEKIGFKIEGRQREAHYILGNYHDAILMGLLKREFLELHPNP